MKVLIIVNPHSGKGQSEKYSIQLKEHLENDQHQVELRISQEVSDIYDWAVSAQGEGFDWVICSGGDGTVNQTINGLMQNEQRPVFGFLPLGTVNDLGRALKCPLNPEAAVTGFNEAEIKTIDVGMINGRYFATTCAIGSLAESVMQTTSEDKNKLGKLAYIRDGLSAVMNEESDELEIIDGQGNSYHIQTNLVVVGLTNSVGGYEQMNVDAEVDDGLMYLSAVIGSSVVDMTQALFEGKLFALETDKLLTIKDKQLRIRANNDADLTTNIDGDPGPKLPIELKVVPSALQVLVPKHKGFFQAFDL